MTTKRKPDIPTEFKSINGWMGLYYIVHGLALWLGSASLGYLLWSYQGLPLFAKLPALVLLVVLSGFGMFFMSLLGHEGFHGNMNTNRDISMAMGIVASCVAPFFASTGYNVMHWQHHMHTNTSEDPDYMLYRGNRTLLSRVFNGPRQTATICMKNALALAFSPEALERTFPFSKAKARAFAVFNLTLMPLVLLGYAALAYLTNAQVAVFLVVLPTLASQSYWALAPYIEHAGVGVGMARDTRTVTSGVLKVLLVGYNFHLCHHLYPRVQLHKLPALYRHLESTGFLSQETVVEKSMFRALKIGATSALKF
jgi:beta-carotene hydroxylase